MKRRILVCGYAGATQVAHQVGVFRALGAEVLVLEPFALFDAGVGRVAWDAAGLRWNGVDLREPRIDAVLVSAQSPEFPLDDVFALQADGRLDWPSWYQHYGVQRDRADTLLGFLLTLELEGVAMFNPPSRTLTSRRKPYQLQVLRRAGCPVPETLITNDPVAARDFLGHFANVVAKPVAGGSLTLSASALAPADLERLRRAPAILQERIQGRDLRVVVVDDRVVSSVAVNVPPGTLDFRADETYQSGCASYDEAPLPAAVEQLCVRAARTLGLRFTGIDIKLTEDGEYVFLECNSSPIYLDVELKTGHPITEALGWALLSG